MIPQIKDSISKILNFENSIFHTSTQLRKIMLTWLNFPAFFLANSYFDSTEILVQGRRQSDDSMPLNIFVKLYQFSIENGIFDCFGILIWSMEDQNGLYPTLFNSLTFFLIKSSSTIVTSKGFNRTVWTSLWFIFLNVNILLEYYRVGLFLPILALHQLICLQIIYLSYI